MLLLQNLTSPPKHLVAIGVRSYGVPLIEMAALCSCRIGKFQRVWDKFKIFVKITACAKQDSASDAINPSHFMWDE